MTHSPAHRGQRGFSMFIVIMAMFVTSMFVAAAYAAANGDLPMGGDSKDRKIAYAAAEAGLNFYLTHLGQDPDYWTKCENVPPPNASDPNPVSRYWNGTGTDNRRWRNVTGSTTQYTLEILPANGKPYCIEGDNTSALDMKTGVLRVRATGRPTATDPQRRSIVANLRRKGFLDFLYYTDYEDSDPQSLATQTDRDNADTYCKEKYRWQRPISGAPSGYGCPEIQFVTGDSVNGPLHSNDSLLICNSPIFGRDSDDKIELVPKTNDTVQSSSCTSNTPVFKGVHMAGAPAMKPPTTNTALRTVAQDDGYLFKGRTIIRVNGSQLYVNNNGTTQTLGFPSNGVIYVDANGACNPIQYPAGVEYDDPVGCGNVYVSGTYSESLTIAAANDIVIAPTKSNGTIDWTSADSNILRSGDPVLGLIATNFVRVGHRVVRTYDSRGKQTNCDNFTAAMDDKGLQVDAAILSLQHSWIVDNYNCGNKLGKLTVNGAIAQRYRGPVGTGGATGTGFLKDYWYDNRLRYRSPPHFLTPIDSAWTVIRSNEQVGAP
jgi:hypothetical protein